MSIASEITRISGNVADAYTAANAKGATMPVTQNSANLASTISTIQTGTTPTGTIQITTNGTHDVTNYANADVQVPTTAPAYYIEKTKNGNGKALNASYLMDLSTFTDVGNYVFTYAYYGNTNISGVIDLSGLTTLSGQDACHNMFVLCTGITSVDLSSLTRANGQYACQNMFKSCTGITSIDLSSLTIAGNNYVCDSMFSGCTGITSIDLSSLTTSVGTSACSNMFSGCTHLTSVDLSGLTTVSGQSGCSNMFSGCTGITSNIDLSSLTTASGNFACSNMFSGCTGLTSVDLSSLAIASGRNACTSMFSGCTGITTLSFPSLKTVYDNQVFNNMLSSVTGATVHFPSNMSSYNFSVGGTNTTVLFDLPATNTLTGVDTVTYTRNPKYDTGTALAWKVGAYGTTNFTPAYYTSGLTDPTVGTTIYSDAACTISVTTVDTVA